MLTNANALSQLSASASGVLGPIVGSALIAVIGVPLAFLANSVSFLFSAACEYRITLTAAAGGACRGMLQDIQEGWKAMIAEPLIARTIVTILVVNFFFSAIPVMVPVLAEGIFKTGAAGLGVLMSSFALGMLLGAAGLSAMHAALRRGVLIIGGLAALGMAFLFMSMILSMPVTIMGLVMAGLALSAVNITLISLYQEILPDRVRGRVFGFLTAISLSTQPIAYGVMGALVDILTPRVVFLFSGIIIVICSLNLIRCRELRSL